MHNERQGLAQVAGLGDLDTPQLEDVDRRRLQLWLLSLVVMVGTPLVIVSIGPTWAPDWMRDVIDVRVLRGALLALLVAVLGYVAERERTLRRLSRMLVSERVLTASLLSRVDELDLLLGATRALNSSLSVAVFADTAAAAITNARTHDESRTTLATLAEMDRLREEFLVAASHELRTPVAALVGIATTLRASAARLDPTEVQTLADMAARQGWRLERLVANLLSSAEASHEGLRVAPREHADIAAVVQETVTALAATSPSHVVRCTVPDEPVPGWVDVDALTQISGNLVANALTHTPAGTVVEVSVRARSGRLELVVNDDGPGISPDLHASVFDKFRRARHDAAGLGLGLFLVRSQARAHGGDATLQPVRAGGCRFSVSLDIAGERWATLTAGHGDAPGGGRGRATDVRGAV